MEQLTQKLRAAVRYVSQPFQKSEAQVTELSKKNTYLNAVCKVLLWEDPALTWVTIIFFHFLWWFIIVYKVRLYACVCLLLLAIFVLDMYVDKRALQQPSSEHSRALLHAYDALCDNVRDLLAFRREDPTSFCCFMCFVSLVVLVIANNISGYVVVYAFVLMVFFGPFLMSLIPKEHVRIVLSYRTGYSVNGVEESDLIPDNLEERDDDDLESFAKGRTEMSVTASYIEGPSEPIPSHLDVDESENELQEEDLEPAVPFGASGVPASDSDSDGRSINFDSSHFNPDSSSEDDNSFSKNLRITEDHTDTTDGIISNLATVGSHLVSNVLSKVTKPRRSESDSDFEVIDADELDES